MRVRVLYSVVLALALVAPVGCSGYGSSRSPEAQVAFGVSMARRGLWNEALFRFRQADRMDPNNPHILNNLAVAFEATGEFDQALETYKRALKASPSSRDLRRNYSRFVEFYQSYRPQKEEPKAGAEGEARGKSDEKTGGKPGGSKAPGAGG